MIKGERPSEDRPLPRYGARPAAVAMDPASKAIIGLLQLDARRPYADIAEQVGLSEDEVVSRVQRLLQSGIVQLTAVTDPLQLGFARQALLGLNVDHDHVEAVARALADVDEIVYVVVSTGGFEVIAEVVGDSDAHLLEIVTSRVRSVPGVIGIHTFLYLRLEKQSYSWGTR